MGTTMWRGLLILAGAALLVLTTGTAVVAMFNDDDDGGARITADERRPNPQGGAVAAICAPGFPDCQDTIVEGDGGFEQCAAAQPCGDFDAKCAADSPCVEPASAPQLACPEGASVEECFEEGVPAGYDCITRESFPVQVVCFPAECVPYDDSGVTTLPAPAPYDKPIEEPLVDPSDPGIAVGEPAPPTEICIAPGDCADEDVIVEGCLGTDPCSRSSEQDTRCLPPDCVISSDGVAHCAIPELCVSIDDSSTAEPVACEPVEPPSGGGGGRGEAPPGIEANAVPVEPQ